MKPHQRDALVTSQKHPPLTPDLLESFDIASEKLANVQKAVSEYIFGQNEVILNTLTAILAGGHVLLIGLPGLAKTKMVSTIAKVLGLDNKRIQCTPDLMPADIIGAEVLEDVDYGKRNFRFIQGPVFCQLLMVDEINRASPRTQAALLQAMQEHNVTVVGREHTLPTPFHVLATQNPIEQEGIYPLPEAQLDRFLLQIDVSYPDINAERMIMQNTSIPFDGVVRSIMYSNELRDMQQLVRQMPLSEAVQEGILNLVRNGRPETSQIDLVKKYVTWGPGPRASQAFSLAARARALLIGNLATTMNEVLSLVKPVLRHRMALSFTARADGVRIDSILQAMIQSVAS